METRSPSHATPLVVVGLACATTLLLAPTGARAQSVRVRSLSAGRLTHFARSDGSTAAPRLLSQALELDAYDLRGDGSGALSARVSMRYQTDLGLPRGLRGSSPLFVDQYNDARLDVAQIQWRPWRPLTLRAGRIWSWTALGPRDLDGASLAARARLGPQNLRLEAHAGRRVSLAYGWYASSTFDVQGLPIRDDLAPADDAPWLMGLSAGYSFDDLVSVSVALQQAVGEARVGDSRAGGALVVTPHARVNLSGHATYHLLMDDLTRAGLELAWRAPGAEGDLSAGLERRRPWFDSASIFNVFGANPYDAAYLNYRQPVGPWRATFDARLWARAFHGDSDTGDLGAGAQDARAVGASLTARARSRLLDAPIQWTARASYQNGLEGYDGDQVLVDAGARAPFSLGELFWLRARLVGLWTSGGSSTRADDALAASGLLGVDLPALDVGVLSVLLEQRLGTAEAPSTNLLFNLSVEVWP
jgi:hypothetical protein